MGTDLTFFVGPPEGLAPLLSREDYDFSTSALTEASQELICDTLRSCCHSPSRHHLQEVTAGNYRLHQHQLLDEPLKAHLDADHHALRLRGLNPRAIWSDLPQLMAIDEYGMFFTHWTAAECKALYLAMSQVPPQKGNSTLDAVENNALWIFFMDELRALEAAVAANRGLLTHIN